MHTTAAPPASAHVRAARPTTLSDLVASGASDRILADTATRTVERLREAGITSSARRLNVLLSALPQAALRATLSRLDPHRPGITHMRRAELLFLLGHIAEGGALFPGQAPSAAERMADVRAILAGICIPA